MVSLSSLLVLLLAASTTAFAPVVAPRPSLASRSISQSSPCATSSRFAVVTPRYERASVSRVQMGLFGLGWAEIGVIGVLALFVLGPEKLAPLAKDFGKSASGLKEVADSFAEGMNEGETGVSKDGGKDAIKSASADESTTE